MYSIMWTYNMQNVADGQELLMASVNTIHGILRT